MKETVESRAVKVAAKVSYATGYIRTVRNVSGAGS